MTELITTDEVFLDDIAGLLKWDDPLTPRLSADEIDASLFTQDVESISSSDGSSPTHKRSSRKEKEKHRQRRYRQRLRDTRESLQRQVDELSTQLLELNERATKKTKTLGTSDELLVCPRWVSEAKYQRQHRENSEAEKQRLIAAVNYQTEYIKGLRQVVSYRRGGGAFGGFTGHQNVPTLHSMTSVLYTTYLQQLEGCYARIDSVMNECGMASLPVTMINSVHKRKNDNSVAYFQQVNKVALPYSFRQICNALCQIVLEQDESALGSNDVAPDDDVFIKTRVLRAMGDGALAQRFVSRQYMEDNRFVLVWKMSSEGGGALGGLHAEETGWISVQPSETGVILSVCVQQIPMRFNLAHCNEPATGQFYNLLHDSLDADNEHMSKCMEKLLIDDVLTGIEC